MAHHSQGKIRYRPVIGLLMVALALFYLFVQVRDGEVASLQSDELITSCLPCTTAPSAASTEAQVKLPYYEPNGNAYPSVRDGSLWTSSPPPEEYRFHLQNNSELAMRIKSKESYSEADWEAEVERVLRDNVEHGVVIVALSNYGMREMTMNWLASLRRNKYEKFVILCFDFIMYRFLCEYGFERNAALIPKGWPKADVGSNFHQWEERAYNEMLHAKIRICLKIFEKEFTIFLH